MCVTSSVLRRQEWQGVPVIAWHVAGTRVGIRKVHAASGTMCSAPLCVPRHYVFRATVGVCLTVRVVFAGVGVHSVPCVRCDLSCSQRAWCVLHSLCPPRSRTLTFAVAGYEKRQDVEALIIGEYVVARRVGGAPPATLIVLFCFAEQLLRPPGASCCHAQVRHVGHAGTPTPVIRRRYQAALPAEEGPYYCDTCRVGG